MAHSKGAFENFSEKGIVSKENTDPLSVGHRLKAACPTVGRNLSCLAFPLAPPPS